MPASSFHTKADPRSPCRRALSIFAPLSYVAFLVVSLSIFSRIYRKRQAKQAPAEPWFPPHKSRDIYVSLLSLDPPPPRPILVAALLRRAMDDVKLIWSVRDAKQSLQVLLQKGQIGDELWERFLLAEKELEAEIVEVVGEANTFEPGYGGKIFNVASDMVSHERWKDVYRDINKKREAENAKLSSSTPPAAVLAPTTYLTPSSLTLSPSNPLPLAGTTPAPSSSTTLTAAASPTPSAAPLPASSSSPAVAPLPQTDAPPSRDSTPVPAAAVDEPAKASSPVTPGASSPAAPGSPELSKAGGSGASTPGKPKPQTPSGKKGKKKPAVKGGR
ncbi:hypothetical protein JCM8547_000704 [Rhodosporidiobolus lusitaniae]